MILQAYHLVQKTQVEERILVKYATLSQKVRYHIHVVRHAMYLICNIFPKNWLSHSFSSTCHVLSCGESFEDKSLAFEMIQTTF